jgi:hypothetical protein
MLAQLLNALVADRLKLNFAPAEVFVNLFGAASPIPSA